MERAWLAEANNPSERVIHLEVGQPNFESPSHAVQATARAVYEVSYFFLYIPLPVLFFLTWQILWYSIPMKNSLTSKHGEPCKVMYPVIYPWLFWVTLKRSSWCLLCWITWYYKSYLVNACDAYFEAMQTYFARNMNTFLSNMKCSLCCAVHEALCLLNLTLKFCLLWMLWAITCTTRRTQQLGLFQTQKIT